MTSLPEIQADFADALTAGWQSFDVPTEDVGFLLAALAAAEAERDRANERLRKVAALLRIPDGARYLNDVKERAEIIARAEAERDALIAALEVERKRAVKAMPDFGPGSQWFGYWQGSLETVVMLEHAAANALASSGSGGPGVHLTADEAEQIAFVLEGRSHSLNCGIWVSGEPCTCGREAALVLLRPAVRGGGQADTEGEL